MKKLDKFFITTLIAGLVVFSVVLAIPTQRADAATISLTAGNIKIKMVSVEKDNVVNLPAGGSAQANVQCADTEVVTGGGFQLLGNRHVIIYSHQNGNGWIAAASNTGDAQGQFRVSATCTHLEIAK